MIFTETKIKDMYIIEPDLLTDERGFFARSFCKDEFQKHGLETSIVQCNVSYNKKKGTFRGMHYQVAPFEEVKIVSCTKGAIYDVVLDLREKSKTYCQWVATEINDKNYKMIYIPKGCAHGFQTLKDETVVYYQMNQFFHPEYSQAVRGDDPVFGIVWPKSRIILSEKDNLLPNFKKIIQ
nr:dTDP-4-dehydrorhamnose 3,5-epimerase [uncultured Methanoregula sp.]